MNTFCRGMRRMTCRRLPGLMAVLLALLMLLVPPRAALAHALDAYLQATYITVRPTQIEVEVDLTPGVLLAPQVLALLDPDGDQHISEAEGRAYVDAMLSNVALKVDGQTLALAVTQIDVPSYLNLQAGYGTIRIFTTAPLPASPPGAHQLEYQNNFAPTGSVYQVNAFVADAVADNAQSDQAMAITLGRQNRDGIQQTMTMDYAIGATSEAETQAVADTATTDSAAASAAATEAAAGASEQMKQLLAYLYAPTLTPWGLLLALGLAGVLGGLHALTPGHGKTLVAAYLVGSRGTTQHAILLGSVTTLTHTASVLAVGVLALTAQQFIMPGVLVPLLEIGSGVLVVLMGLRLVRVRLQSMRGGVAATHDHGFGAHTHALGQEAHTHASGISRADFSHADISRGGILAMGVSGGLIPCPEALGMMLLAIGLNRAGLGLALIVAFSLGLAAVLIALGMLLVRSKDLLERAGERAGQRFGKFNVNWQRWFALGSAGVVTALGVGLVLKGLLVV